MFCPLASGGSNGHHALISHISLPQSVRLQRPVVIPFAVILLLCMINKFK